MTLLCSRNLTQRPAFGGDDIAFPTFGLRTKAWHLRWVTLSAQKWVILARAPRHMRELRIQHQGRPYRVLYAFDPRRNAVLLIGGDKTGNEQWYEASVPLADRLYERH